MRLIDADELDIYDVSPAYGMCVMGVTQEDIDDAPTVEAIPVEWIKRFLEWDWDYLTNAIRFILDKWREEQDWEENATD